MDGCLDVLRVHHGHGGGSVQPIARFLLNDAVAVDAAGAVKHKSTTADKQPRREEVFKTAGSSGADEVEPADMVLMKGKTLQDHEKALFGVRKVRKRGKARAKAKAKAKAAVKAKAKAAAKAAGLPKHGRGRGRGRGVRVRGRFGHIGHRRRQGRPECADVVDVAAVPDDDVVAADVVAGGLPAPLPLPAVQPDILVSNDGEEDGDVERNDSEVELQQDRAQDRAANRLASATEAEFQFSIDQQAHAWEPKIIHRVVVCCCYFAVKMATQEMRVRSECAILMCMRSVDCGLMEALSHAFGLNV